MRWNKSTHNSTVHHQKLIKFKPISSLKVLMTTKLTWMGLKKEEFTLNLFSDKEYLDLNNIISNFNLQKRFPTFFSNKEISLLTST